MVAYVGLDPIKFLNMIPGSNEWCIYIALTRGVLLEQDRRDENLSIRIANAVGKMLGG